MSIMQKLDENVLNNQLSKQAYDNEICIDKISTLLRQIREEQDITQSEIAHNIGLSQQMVSKVECYNGNPSLSTFVKYCNYINIDLEKAILEYYIVHIR